MKSAARIIDANANRAREALRIMEEAARFLFDNRELSQSLKSMRHDLAAALGRLPGWPHAGLAHRDTRGDVGAAISTTSEGVRASERDVVIASCKRLTEALRSIEEYAKIECARSGPEAEELKSLPGAFESIRYRAYEAERALVLAFGIGRASQWRLCVLLSESLCTHLRWEEVAERAIAGGADCLQLREKHFDDRELLRRARLLVALASRRSVSIVVNDRVDIALESGAHGVHLGQGDLPLVSARRIAGDRLLIGVSTSTIVQAERALREGADMCGVGPMFHSTTKVRDSIPGPAYLRAYRNHEPRLPPHLAIGGITSENVHEVVEAGALGLAVSSCVCGARAPDEVCRSLIGALAAPPSRNAAAQSR